MGVTEEKPEVRMTLAIQRMAAVDIFFTRGSMNAATDEEDEALRKREKEILERNFTEKAKINYQRTLLKREDKYMIKGRPRSSSLADEPPSQNEKDTTTTVERIRKALLGEKAKNRKEEKMQGSTNRDLVEKGEEIKQLKQTNKVLEKQLDEFHYNEGLIRVRQRELENMDKERLQIAMV